MIYNGCSLASGSLQSTGPPEDLFCVSPVLDTVTLAATHKVAST